LGRSVVTPLNAKKGLRQIDKTKDDDANDTDN